MISISVDTEKLNRLRDKFGKYPSFAIKAGLNAMSREMNKDSFKRDMYATNRNGSPFVWSSPKQRRFVFANVELPYQRTFGLANAGKFTIDERSFWIEYSNSLGWWIYVLHPQYQIMGHRSRNWPTVNRYVVSTSSVVVRYFKPASIQAWD